MSEQLAGGDDANDAEQARLTREFVDADRVLREGEDSE
jgi:hypothetical protein